MNPIDITKNIKTIEMLKAQMVIECGELMRATAVSTGSTLAAEHVAGVIVSAYLMLMRLGVPPAALDRYVYEAIVQNVGENNELQEELTELARHFARGMSNLKIE